MDRAADKLVSLEPLLDPLWCQMASHAGSPAPHAAPSMTSASSSAPVREDLQQLLSGLARRVAWGGDRRRGTARIELGEGPFAGATLLVHTDQRSVTVEIELAIPGGAAHELQRRILERLEGRGFDTRVNVR